MTAQEQPDSITSLKVPVEASYGQWESGLPAEKIYRLSETATFVRPGAFGIFFLLNIPAEDNIQALMHLSDSGRLQRVSPTGVNVRSRVHEYGALPYCCTSDTVFYCDFSSQRIMRQPFDQQSQTAGPATALTPATDIAALRYADFIVDPKRQRLICVREDHRQRDTVTNTLVAIDINHGGEGTELFSGTDFVAAPRLSPDGSTLAYISWSHPDMPWDNTRLEIATLDDAGEIEHLRTLARDSGGSMVQPQFAPSGDLLFIADWSDWWNIYRIPAGAIKAGATLDAAEHLIPVSAECCGPLWQLGVQSYACIDHNTIALSINRECRWELATFDMSSRQLRSINTGYGALESVAVHQTSASGPGILVCGSSPADTTTIESWSLADASKARASVLYRCANDALLPADSISQPEHLSFPGAGNNTAYGVYYRPCNALYQAPDGERPPLIVMVHGGPTSSAKLLYNPVIQFWTSRGFAVFDVNHHGSTGYGRAFRHSLYKRWGEIDVADVVAGVKHLVHEGMADPQKLAIRGGSAGGYVVLATLAASDLFGAGTSYYGVSDLSLLARDTHKFESHYLEQLIGPWPEAQALYQERSPINHIDRIQAPVLLFQGLLDKVVPPNQAEMVFTHLQHNNPASELVLLEDEAHGFRNPGNQIRVLERELGFYRSVLW